jgi:hypothetical protein
MSKNLSGVDILTDNAGTVIYNGQITTKQITTNALTTNALTTNGNINLTGSIINGSNSITFSESTLYTNIPQNFFINGTGLIQYQGINYNIGQVLAAFVGGGTVSPYPSITYNSGTNTTTFTGSLVFPSSSIASGSINNSDFATISTTQTISNKEFSGTTIFSSIQLNSALILNSGGLTLPQSTLQNIQYLSGLTSNINTRFTTNETNITALQTKTTNMTFGSNITTFTGTMVFPTSSISFNAIVGTACTLGQNQTITGTKTFSAVQNFTSNLRLDGSLLVGTAGNVILTNATLQKIAFISDTTSAVGANLTSLQNQINAINTDYITETELNTALSPLQTKTQYISSTSLNTTITNTTNLTDVVFSGNLNTIPASYFTGISSNIQNQINDAVSKASAAQDKADSADTKAVNADNKAGSALALAGVANGAAVAAAGIATGAAATAAGAVSVNTTQQTEIDDLQVDVAALQVKTTQISYNAATSRTTVSQTLNAPFLEIGDLTSGINQTATSQITLAGLLRCNNRVEINNTLELINNNNIILEGIINQDNANPPNNAVNQFLAPTNILGTLTVSGNQSNTGNFTTSGTQTSLNSTNTQIGTNAISTLTINSNTICNGDFTMLSNKNLRLKNILPILLDDIIFGDAIGTYNGYNTIFNTQIIANQSLTLNANFQQGTNLARKTYLGYNDTYTTYASTSATLSSPAIYLTGTNTTLTTTATLSVSSLTNSIISTGTTSITGLTTNVDGTFINIGNVLSTNILYGATYVQALYSPSGTINAIGTAMQQFV